MRDPEPCDDPRGHSWTETTPSCELCGDHEGLYCPRCGETVDLAFTNDPRGKVNA